MFIDASTYKRNGKIYRRALLRNSYRVNGKVCHDTIANLSSCSDEEIKALKLALKHKNNLSTLTDITESVQIKQGLGVGGVWVLYQIAKELHLVEALGTSRLGKLGLWLIMACIIEQGSRLSAVRLAQRHHVCEILGLEGFNENDLYKALDELSLRQHEIEDKLFSRRYGNRKPNFYLYDVTSSYFEGECNELSYYGYNRDNKKGKKQIVIGLMTDDEGVPITIEVFEGNTQDPKTVYSQIKKIANRFGVKEVTFVGDRGMIKQAQVDDLLSEGFHYISAITKPQIESLVHKGIMQLSLFHERLIEVKEGNIRYVLHRNPVRAEEINKIREAKIAYLENFVSNKNQYLAEHSKAQAEIALRDSYAKAKQLNIDSWVLIEIDNRILSIKIDKVALEKAARYDGCYVIKTDLSEDKASYEQIHSRYKDLAMVERAFRTMKTVLLEMRAIYVRKANRTRAHVFVIMLSYLLVQRLQSCWHDVELTVEEGIKELVSICSMQMNISNHICQIIPEPRDMGKLLLKKLNITLPEVIPCKNVKVVTTKKLVSERNI